MKWAIAAVGGPSGSPGKLRFRLPPSSGEQRAPASAAGRFWAGMTIRRPWIAPGIELADQAREHDLALVLVAVIAGAEVQRGAGAVPDHRDRDADPAVRRDVARVRQLQMADLLALLVEVDEAADPGLLGSWVSLAFLKMAAPGGEQGAG